MQTVMNTKRLVGPKRLGYHRAASRRNNEDERVTTMNNRIAAWALQPQPERQALEPLPSRFSLGGLCLLPGKHIIA